MIFLRTNLPNYVQFKQHQGNRDHGIPRVCLKQDFSVYTIMNINSLNTNTVTQ